MNIQDFEIIRDFQMRLHVEGFHYVKLVSWVIRYIHQLAIKSINYYSILCLVHNAI